MRKSLSPLPSNEGGGPTGTARVFGVPLEEVARTHTFGGLEVPALVKDIVDYIEEHGHLDLEGPSLVNGNAERVGWLRRRYDNGEEVALDKDADLASAVSLLRLFLQELPEPVISAPIQGPILQLYQEHSSEEELCRNMKFLLQQLPQLNYALLRFLCRFLASVAALQRESWNVRALAAVFGPDIFHLSTEGEDLRDQASVSRVLTGLLDNQEGLFDSDDDEVSTTNDYSSINEQITELLDDDKCEAECEELPQDSEDGPATSNSLPHNDPADSSHLSPVPMLPADSAEIIERTIRAAVEHHFFELKSSIDQDLGNFESQQGDAAQPAGCRRELQQKEEQKETQDALGSLEECPGMELDALRDSENNISGARGDNQPSDSTSCDISSCDQNANTSQMSSSDHTPHIQLFPNHQWDDPVPAFKSWQEESESGEAQLSPLAGRMVPLPLLPLEEDDDGDDGSGEGGREDASPSSSRSHPHHLARRFLDFGVHGAQRFLHQDADATSPTKAHRPRRASFGSKEALRGSDSVTHQLTRKLQHLKKKIKQFEEQFEKEKNYKPSHGDKASNTKVLKWMTDLTKIRRQIKGRQHHLFPRSTLRHQAVLHSHRPHPAPPAPSPLAHCTLAPHSGTCHLNAKHRAESELGPQTRPRSNTLPKSFGSTLEQTASRLSAAPQPTREETLELIQRRVTGKRQEDGWPDDIKKMTKEQLSCEKTVLQKNLLHYEGLHGRPVTREERLVVKPLYERYRLIKQMLTRVAITPAITVSPSSKRRTQTLQPIIEGETAHFWEDVKEEEEERSAGDEEEDEQEEKKDEGDYNEEDEDEEEEEEGESSGGEMQSSEVIMAMETSTTAGGGDSIRTKMEEGSGKMALDLRLSSSNASSMPELLEQLWKARAEKKKLRKAIREFEEEFYQRNGRNVQKEDREPMLEEYRAYKRLKAKLRLLEVLISKQDSSKSI
ncbi:protein FAM13B isoform X3 [Syngnathoides biaculeatus]|uniref:protein FAM13B isoform X3 n=1 Tax=Syngnathoides biaculeatus TaxID=300417 RepID=UPI002ADDEB9F|nr:protein FAM13B isoform X3 [Syngnathoides biaculeatus]